MPHGTTGVPNVQNATRVADEFAGIISSAGGSADRCVTAPAALRTCDPVRAVANTTTPAATNPRPTDRVSDIGSAKWTTPRITWKTAEMYCSIPSVAKRSCLTEALSKSSGTTVTKPVEASKSRWGEPVVQVVGTDAKLHHLVADDATGGLGVVGHLELTGIRARKAKDRALVATHLRELVRSGTLEAPAEAAVGPDAHLADLERAIRTIAAEAAAG